MRSLIRVLFVLVLTATALGQTRFGGGNFGFGGGNAGFGFGTPRIVGGFGNAVFPGGTPANSPNVTRFTPNAVFPGGGGPRLFIPGRGPQRYTGTGGGIAVPFAYPVYTGGYGYDNSYADDPPQDPQQALPQQGPPQQQPGATVVFPPSAPPVIARQYGDQNGAAPPPVADQPAPSDLPDHYLIALKDHTVYPVVAYWIQGDTLHYFMPGNVHNQVSLSLVDQPLTVRLNHELGINVNMPAVQ
jgi:hypothetical protein